MIEQARKLARSVLHTDDTPDRIARGVGVGMLVAWTPTVGIQMIVAAIAAWICRGNKACAVAIVWITNPYTIVPIYWCNYQVGHLLLGGPIVGWSWFFRLLNLNESRGWWEYMMFVYAELRAVAAPLWLGSVLLGTPIAIVSYFGAFEAVRRHRQRKAAAHPPVLESVDRQG